MPLLIAISEDHKILTGRAKTVSIFYDSGIESKLWEMHTLNGPNFPPLVSRFFHNKPYFYLKDMLRRYSQHFSLDFLLVTGDPHPPFDMPRMGNIYMLDAIFASIGLFLVITNIRKRFLALILLLLVAPTASSFTFVTPAANRSFLMVISLSILTALGIIYAVKIISHKSGVSWKFTALFFVTLYLISFSYYANSYFKIIPFAIPEKWHYGSKELVSKVSEIETDYKKVVISNKGSPSYIWFLFYKKYDPELFRRSAQVNNMPDEFGFIQVDSFDNYYFVKKINWDNLEKESDVLYVGFQNEIPSAWVGKINGIDYKVVSDNRVNYPNGDTVFKLAHLDSEKGQLSISSQQGVFLRVNLL